MSSILLILILIAFVAFYTYMVGGDTSMWLLYMLILSPFVSWLLTFPARRALDISVDISSSEIERDGIVPVVVSVSNMSFLPVPFVYIHFSNPSNLLISGNDTVRVSLGPYQNRMITREYVACRRGVGEVGVSKVVLRDYLDIFRYSMAQSLGSITVLPRVHKLRSNIRILSGGSETNVLDDSGSSNTNVQAWMGEPGYEFREYVPGDPLHKIHWKLSAKKDSLLIRKDEGRGIPRKCIIIDPCMTDLRTTAAIQERVLEAVLSVSDVAVRCGRDVEVWTYQEAGWEQKFLKDVRDVRALAYSLAAFRFCNQSVFEKMQLERLPLTPLLEQRQRSRHASGGEVLIFTGVLEDMLAVEAEKLKHYKMHVDFVSLADLPEDIHMAFENQ